MLLLWQVTKHGVLLIVHFHVFYFHYSSTLFLLELVEKSYLKKSPFSISV